MTTVNKQSLHRHRIPLIWRYSLADFYIPIAKIYLQTRIRLLRIFPIQHVHSLRIRYNLSCEFMLVFFDFM